jgi:trehalose 6-phosphate phosphatase
LEVLDKAGPEQPDALEPYLPRPLIGLQGIGDWRPRLHKGNLGTALDKLGDVTPGQLLFATDFDGTLAPIERHPDAATPVPANLALVDRMVEMGVRVAVISGRAQHDLRARLQLLGPRVLGENGLTEIAAPERRALDRFNARVGRLIAMQPGVWLECKPASSSVHFRGAPEAGPDLRTTVAPIASRFGLVATMGRMVIEARPQGAEKARAIAALIDELQPKAVVYAGDDEPDQCVFELLSRLPRPHVTVGVSSPERGADKFQLCDLVVEGPEAMAAFLTALLERLVRRLAGQ